MSSWLILNECKVGGVSKLVVQIFERNCCVFLHALYFLVIFAGEGDIELSVVVPDLHVVNCISVFNGGLNLGTKPGSGICYPLVEASNSIVVVSADTYLSSTNLFMW